MAFATGRQFSSKAPVTEVAASRGAAGAPGAASIPPAGQGGSMANDIGGVLGIGGGMLGKFLWDKYHTTPEETTAETVTGNIGIPEGTNLVGVTPGQMGGALGLPQNAINAMSMPDPAQLGGSLGITGSNFGSGIATGLPISDYYAQMNLPWSIS